MASVAPVLLLGHEIHRAQLERADGRGGAGPGVGAHHHDRPRRLRHDVADGAEAVELRHLEVHEDQVGLLVVHLLQRVHPVPRGGDDPELPAPVHHVGQQPPEERAVVDHQDGPRLRGSGHRAPPTRPRPGRPPPRAAPCGRSRRPLASPTRATPCWCSACRRGHDVALAHLDRAGRRERREHAGAADEPGRDPRGCSRRRCPISSSRRGTAVWGNLAGLSSCRLSAGEGSRTCASPPTRAAAS